MGVRGLTSFIAKNAEQYLRPYELHDCNLVIDGDNLACNLYKDVSNCNSAFGGDYDEYYRTVIIFFNILSECNICSYVLLDGGYERKKMKTTEKRLRGKIALIKHIDPSNSKPMFPLMMREVFVDAARDSGAHVMRCIFEADDELAALARKLNCPLLSYDSDFYIHNVKYIPLITLTMKVYEKKESKFGKSTELRQCQAKNLKKRKQINRGLNISIDETTKLKKNKIKNIKYLDCCIYRVEYLIEKGSLSKSKLPIFAALLGNDYIQSKVFNKFYSQVGLKGFNKKIPKHQKKVLVILKWLRHETKKSALDKILSSIKKEQRDMLLKQIETATEGYLNETCISFEFFQLNEADYINNFSDNEESDEDEDNHCNIENNSSNEEEENIEGNSSNEEDENIEGNSSNEENESTESDELQEKELSELEEVNENEKESENDTLQESSDKENEHCETAEITDVTKTNIILDDNEQLATIPLWMRRRINSAELPRFFSDLYNLKLYINNPQIENFLFPDCNEIALPILLTIFSIVQHPNTPDLRYLTRVTRLTNVIYKRIPTTPLTKPINFQQPEIDVIKEQFSLLKIDQENLFNALKKFPCDLHLYFLAIIYWSHKSLHTNLLHLKSLLICLIILRAIDTKVEPIREEKQFHKKFNKLIQKEKISRIKINSLPLDSEKMIKIEKNQEILKNIPIEKRLKCIPKIECILVQENVLKYFNYQETLRNKHTEFSSTILHGFAEFQSVVFQLYSLNILVNKPFETIKMSQLYSGIFLYNIYLSLQQRPNVMYYIQHFIFKESEIMYEYFENLIEFLTEFVPFLKKNNEEIKFSKKLNKKKNAIKKKLNNLNGKMNESENINIK